MNHSTNIPIPSPQKGEGVLEPVPAILLMAYGAASSLDDIPDYLQDIRGGRTPTPGLIAAVREKYQQIGGRSPLLDISLQQGATLEARLKSEGLDSKVYLGMRHSEPTILKAVAAIKDAGHSVVVAMPLTPYKSDLSTGAYFKKYEEAVAAINGLWQTIRVESWCKQRAFVSACVEKAKEGISRFKPPCTVLFTAHSLPAKIIEHSDPYPDQLRETVVAVADELDLDRWEFAYQSRGQTSEPWLGPDAGETIERLARSGCKNLLLAPIGFISDHMETLYDDDIQYRGQAEKLGVHFERAETLNTFPLLIEAMANAIDDALTPAIDLK